jgi:16S rRNA (uracil1498-N3)-methyltransferase
MALPMFFVEELEENLITLPEESSKHAINVLRMQNKDEILLTDGKGKKARTVIVDDNRKKCRVQVLQTEKEEPTAKKISIAVSIIKNSSRLEWFIEKATELGVNEIIPMICKRTEKEKFRFDRMKQLMISAMLQSQQCWLPELYEPMHFEKLVLLDYENKLIAHCLPEVKMHISEIEHHFSNQLILIGPEGDFTPEEISTALNQKFLPVSLGSTRLRTETAAITAAILLRLG